MASIQQTKAFNVALSKGAFSASQDYAVWDQLVSMSKRELIEIAVRLGASAAGECDSAAAGIKAVFDEHEALKANGII